MRYAASNRDASDQTVADELRISAIIPAWNEAATLPSLLRHLAFDPQVSEIIVADNHSCDGTVALATAAGCRVVVGGRPAAGRNAGASGAIGDLLMFCDADVVISDAVLAAVQQEFQDPERCLIHFRLVPATNHRLVKACYGIADFYAQFCQLIGNSQGSAPVICVRRSAFAAVGGFDTAVHVAEDLDFIRRVRRQLGGVAYLRATPVYVSARRFDLEPAVAYALKCVLWGALRFVGLRVSVLRYSWTPYPTEVNQRAAAALDAISLR